MDVTGKSELFIEQMAQLAQEVGLLGKRKLNKEQWIQTNSIELWDKRRKAKSKRHNH